MGYIPKAFNNFKRHRGYACEIKGSNPQAKPTGRFHIVGCEENSKATEVQTLAFAAANGAISCLSNQTKSSSILKGLGHSLVYNIKKLGFILTNPRAGSRAYDAKRLGQRFSAINLNALELKHWNITALQDIAAFILKNDPYANQQTPTIASIQTKLAPWGISRTPSDTVRTVKTVAIAATDDDDWAPLLGCQDEDSHAVLDRLHSLASSFFSTLASTLPSLPAGVPLV